MENFELERLEFLSEADKKVNYSGHFFSQVIVGPGEKLSRHVLMDKWINRLTTDAKTNPREYFYPIVKRRFEEVTGKKLNPKTHLLVCMNTYSQVVPEGYNNLEPMFVVFKKDIKEEDNKIPFVMPIEDPFYLMSIEKARDLVQHTLEQPICLDLDHGNIYFKEEIDIDLSYGLKPIQD